MDMSSHLIASHHMLSGAPTSELSRYSFAERARAVAAADMSGLGLGIADLLDGIGRGELASDLAATARSHAIAVADIETLIVPLEPDEQTSAAADDILMLAAELGARRVNVTIMGAPAPKVDSNRAAERLGELADRAAPLGLSLALEFMPYRAVSSLPMALGILRQVGRPNCGLLLDTLHFFRSGGQVSDVGLIEPAEIFSVQLADAPAQPPADLLVESRTARMLPGHGGLPLVDLMKRLRSSGAQPALEIEVISEQLRRMDVDEVAAQAARSASAVLEAAGFSPVENATG